MQARMISGWEFRRPVVGPRYVVKFLPAVLAMASWSCGGLAGAVPPPPEQDAANCSEPTYASDQLVCADPALLALDRRMVELMAVAGPRDEARPLHGFEPQQDWFRRRSRCAFSSRHAACLRAAYRERIEVLSAMTGRSTGRGRPALPAICTNAPWGEGLVGLQLGKQAPVIIEDGRGGVLMVASARQPRNDWSPFVRFGIEGRRIRLETLGGAVIRCLVVEERRGGAESPSVHGTP